MHFQIKPIYARLILCCCISAGTSAAWAIAPVDSEPVVDSKVPLMGETERWSIHGQATYMLQQRNNFNSPYAGQNSLLNKSASPAESLFH
jgi:high affinity Mn2+ porin